MAERQRVTWGEYELYVCPGPNETTWKDEGGVYVFAGLGTNDSGQSVWYAYYAGQTKSLAERLPNHERWDEAAGLGATHAHAVVVPDAQVRDVMERYLIENYHPTLNTQHR